MILSPFRLTFGVHIVGDTCVSGFLIHWDKFSFALCPHFSLSTTSSTCKQLITDAADSNREESCSDCLSAYRLFPARTMMLLGGACTWARAHVPFNELLGSVTHILHHPFCVSALATAVSGGIVLIRPIHVNMRRQKWLEGIFSHLAQMDTFTFNGFIFDNQMSEIKVTYCQQWHVSEITFKLVTVNDDGAIGGWTFFLD